MDKKDNLGAYLLTIFVGMFASYGASYLVGEIVDRIATKAFMPSMLKD